MTIQRNAEEKEKIKEEIKHIKQEKKRKEAE